MKKLGSLVLLTVLLLCLASCKNGFGPKNNEKKGTVTLNINQNARTMMPNGLTLNLNQVNEWTVEFVNKDAPGTVYKDSLSFSDFPKEFNYPEGSYDVHVTGQFTKNLNVDGTWKDVSFNYKGSSEVTVTAETDKDLTVSVSLYQAENAEGSFQYNITLKENVTKDLISEGDTTPTNNNTTEVSINGYKFRSYLTSTSDSSKKVDLLLNMNITAREDWRQYYTNLRISSDTVPAGYYYFTLEYEKDGVIKVFDNIPDPVVLIIDGLKVFPADLDMDDYSFNPVKNIYVSNNGKNNLGLTPQNARDLELTLKELKEGTQGYEWKAINLYFIEERRLGTVSVLDLHKGVAPLINVDYIPTTSGDGKLITLYVSEKDESILEIKDGQLYYLDSSAETILYADKEKYSEAPAELTVNFVPEYDYWDSRFYLANTKLTINNAEGLYGTIVVLGSDIATAYTDESTPVLTLNYSQNKSAKELEELYVKYLDVSDYKEDVSVYSIKKFIKEKNDLPVVEFYTTYIGKEILTYSANIPFFDVEKNNNGLNGESIFTIKTELNGETEIPFGEGAVISWFINNHIIAGENSKELCINFNECPYTKFGNNTVTALVTCNGEYRSKSIIVSISQSASQQIIYFNPISDSAPSRIWATDYNNLYASGTDLKIYAFCYDNNKNFYAAILTEDTELSILKWNYEEETGDYNAIRKTLATVTLPAAGQTEFPSRIACDGTNVYMITRGNVDFLNEYNNTLYCIPVSETEASYESYSVVPELSLNDNGFSKITAITCDADYLYVAGETENVESAHETYLNGEITVYNNQYAIKKFTVDTDGTATFENDVYTYTDENMINDYPVLAEYDSDDDEITLKVSLECPVLDMSTYKGSIFMLRSVISNNKYVLSGASYENSAGQNYLPSIIHIENGITRIIDMPSKVSPNGSGETDNIYPTRILAIKPKEIVLADAKGSQNSTTNIDIVDVYNGTTSLLRGKNTQTYNYEFDSILNGSGSVMADFHDVKLVTITK